ncbi:MAG: hypothetical protein K6G57_00725 [Lachnospiraceae bacterium]|nr:hypothetical protein [Lachnospiraceae bacterium]
MKSFKTYLAVYPFLYKIVIIIVMPLIVFKTGFSACLEAVLDTYIKMMAGGMIVMAAELYGEFYSMGAICTKKLPFGELLMSSPYAKEFVKRFAVADAVRKIVINTLIFTLPQVILMIMGEEYARPFLGLAIGVTVSFAVLFGTWFHRNTSSPLMFMVVLLATAFVFAFLSAFTAVLYATFVKYIFFVISLGLMIMMVFVSIHSLVKSVEGDFYDIRH